MNIFEKFKILNLDKIDEFDIKTEKGKFLFVYGNKFNANFLYNWQHYIVKNFDYIIFSNTHIQSIEKMLLKDQFGLVSPGWIDCEFDIEKDQVVPCLSWGFSWLVEYGIVNYNNHLPNNSGNVHSFLLENKFIFPTYSVSYYKEEFWEFLFKQNAFLNSNLIEKNLEDILLGIWPQIVSLTHGTNKFPSWAEKYCSKAIEYKEKITDMESRIELFNLEIDRMNEEKAKEIRTNEFLWSTGNNLENSIEVVMKKIFPDLEILKSVDKEDLIFRMEKSVFVLEIKGSKKYLNENWLMQLAKYIISVEEKYKNEQIFPILFINSQFHMEPIDRFFQYNPEILERIHKYKISVITSTRLFNLLERKDYLQIKKDMMTVGIHEEKITLDDPYISPLNNNSIENVLEEES